jgi:acetyl-CoA acetyltransferase family protein
VLTAEVMMTSLEPRDAVIVAARRTPIGRRGGGLSAVRPDDLAAALVRGLLAEVPLPAERIDDLIVGCATPVGEQGWNIARQIGLLADLPVSVPGVTVNRMCASSDQAVQFAAQGIRSGDVDVVLAAGVESMSRVPMASDGVRFSTGIEKRWALPPQGRSAERMRERWGFSRPQLDDYALRSHARAVSAARERRFDAEILAVDTTGRDHEPVRLRHDEGPRPDTSREKLAVLEPAFERGGAVTAGNSSQMSDGAAALLLMAAETASAFGLRPRARFVRGVSVGSDPVLQLSGVIEATRRVLKRAGMKLSEIDHFEVNEAFSCVPLAWQHELRADARRLNPRGGAIALGHPLGATGARMLVTMLHALEETGGRFGLQTMCIGHGMANATVIERLDP